jgi:hypothetical protein
MFILCIYTFFVLGADYSDDEEIKKRQKYRVEEKDQWIILKRLKNEIIKGTFKLSFSKNYLEENIGENSIKRQNINIDITLEDTDNPDKRKQIIRESVENFFQNKNNISDFKENEDDVDGYKSVIEKEIDNKIDLMFLKRLEDMNIYVVDFKNMRVFVLFIFIYF